MEAKFVRFHLATVRPNFRLHVGQGYQIGDLHFLIETYRVTVTHVILEERSIIRLEGNLRLQHLVAALTPEQAEECGIEYGLPPYHLRVYKVIKPTLILPQS
jgi:hypothetical protein